MGREVQAFRAYIDTASIWKRVGTYIDKELYRPYIIHCASFTEALSLIVLSRHGSSEEGHSLLKQAFNTFIVKREDVI